MSETSIDAVIGKLTDRRRQVLNQLLLGASDSDIAIALGISEPTVRKHIERICEFFAQELSTSGEKPIKRADLIRLVASQRPEMTVPHHQLQEEAKRLNEKGFEAYLAGNFAIAAQYFQAALTLDKNCSDAHYNLGMIYEMLRQDDEARHHYEVASQFKGDGAYAAMCNLARLSILAGKPEESVAMLQRCLDDKIDDTSTKVAIYKNLGWAFYLLGDYNQATENLGQAITLNSASAASHCLMAQVFEKIGNMNQAKECWLKCLEGDTSDDDTSESSQKSWEPGEMKMWRIQAFQFLHNFEQG